MVITKLIFKIILLRFFSPKIVIDDLDIFRVCFRGINLETFQNSFHIMFQVYPNIWNILATNYYLQNYKFQVFP